MNTNYKSGELNHTRSNGTLPHTAGMFWLPIGFPKKFGWAWGHCIPASYIRFPVVWGRSLTGEDIEVGSLELWSETWFIAQAKILRILLVLLNFFGGLLFALIKTLSKHMLYKKSSQIKRSKSFQACKITHHKLQLYDGNNLSWI
jgi:hypothetical protein